MLKYASYDIVFSEIPDQVTLAINLSQCPLRCNGCHSPHLWDDTGDELTVERLDVLVDEYTGLITCLCLMGGDGDTEGVAHLFEHERRSHPQLLTAWYSGRSKLPHGFRPELFDYVKLGPYDAEKGGLAQPTTNQRLYHIDKTGQMTDITERFWTK